MTAKCELVQKEGGMYALNVRPQEAGEHHLSVTYKGEHIEGAWAGRYDLSGLGGYWIYHVTNALLIFGMEYL